MRVLFLIPAIFLLVSSDSYAVGIVGSVGIMGILPKVPTIPRLPTDCDIKPLRETHGSNNADIYR